MSKITHVEEFTKNNGKKGWKFTIDGTVTGYISNEKPWEYKEGEDVSYTTVDKGTWKLLTLTRLSGTPAPPPQQQAPAPSTPPTPVGNVTPPDTTKISSAKSFTEMKFEGRVVCIKLAIECILQGKFERPEALEAFAEWITVLDASIDELKAG